MNKKVIIVLSEIYGVNRFIKEQCEKYATLGFDVVAPDIIKRKPFEYDCAKQAYNNFKTNVGFDLYMQITDKIIKLKETYEKVYVLGFSVGATLAWRCSENSHCTGIVACYGSRIRDYVNTSPACKTLLIFAENDSFDVKSVVQKLKEKENTSVYTLGAHHGFMDRFSESFESECAAKAQQLICDFLS